MWDTKHPRHHNWLTLCRERFGKTGSAERGSNSHRESFIASALLEIRSDRTETEAAIARLGSS